MRMLHSKQRGVIQSGQPEDFGQLIGFRAIGEGRIVDYTSDDWATLQQRIDEALPTMYNDIVSISDDFSVAVINSNGPREPGAYYLLIGGSQLASLGRSMPFLKREELADMSYVTYEARDGLQIPAYLTMPTNRQRALSRGDYAARRPLGTRQPAL